MPFTGYATPVATKHYVTPQGGRVSMFSGVVPAGSVLTPSGYDVEWSDGTVGRCKPAFATEQEAIDFARDWNAKRIAAYVSVGQTAPPLPSGAPR